MKERNKNNEIKQGKINIVDVCIFVLVAFVIAGFVTFLLSDKYTGPDIFIDTSNPADVGEPNGTVQIVRARLLLPYSCTFEAENEKEANQFDSMSDLPSNLQIVAGNKIQIVLNDKPVEVKIIRISEYDAKCVEQEIPVEVVSSEQSAEPINDEESSNAQKRFQYSSNCYIVVELNCVSEDDVTFFAEQELIAVDRKYSLLFNEVKYESSCVSIVKGVKND